MACLEMKKHFSVDLKKAVLIIYDAWKNVKVETIANCFQKTGIIKQLDNPIDENENDPLLEQFENDPLLKQFSNELENLIVEDGKVQTEKILSEDEILGLCQDVYEVNDAIADAENGTTTADSKPFALLDALNVILDNELIENQFSALLSSKAIQELKDMREEVESFISSKTRQTTLHEFAL